MNYYIANLLIILITFISTIIYSNNAEEIKNMNKIYTPIIVNDKTKNTNFPTQIHLAYTGIPTEMMISYSTNYSTDNTIAKVRLHSNNNNGSLEFTVAQRDADAFFPITVDFSSPQLFSGVEVGSVLNSEQNAAIQYGMSKGLTAGEYTIV